MSVMAYHERFARKGVDAVKHLDLGIGKALAFRGVLQNLVNANLLVCKLHASLLIPKARHHVG